jgi:hypothetical protein
MYFATTDSFATGSKTSMVIDHTGIVLTTRNYLQAAGSLRAPIFYDSDDTGYYIDPNSTSNTALRMRGGALFGPNVTWGQYLIVGGNGNWNTAYASVTTTDGNLHLDAKAGSAMYLNYYAGTAVNFGNGASGGIFAQVASDGTFRSPIFYDYNNTGYYIDPNAATSAIFTGSVDARTYNYAGLLVNASGTGSSGAAFGIQQVTGEGWTGIFVDYEPNTGWGLYHDNPNNYFCITSESSTGNFRSFTVPSRVSGNRTAYEKIRFDQNNGDIISGNIMYAYGSSRAPIFYDYNDTGYYLDPASTSVLNVLSDPALSDSRLFLRTRGDTNHYLWNAGDDWEELVAYRGTGFRVVNSSGAGTILTCFGVDVGNYVQAATSMRAPIFYDSNDTTYYVDPNTFTYLYGGIQNNGAHASSTIDNRMLAGNNGAGTGVVQLRMWCSEPGITWDWAGFGYNVLNNGGSPDGFGRVNSSFGQAYMRFGTGGDLIFYNVTTGATRYTTMQLHPTGYVTAYQSSRAPLFYDSDNTAYYGDFAGTSILSQVELIGANHKYLYINPGNGYEAMVRYNGGSGNTWYVGKRTSSDLVGTADFHFYSQAAGRTVAGMDTSGNFIAYGNVTAYSDERVKTNWRAMPENFVSRLAKVKVGVYDRTDGSKITQVGVGAQSLQEVLPEAVIKADDEIGTLSVNYGGAALASTVELAKEVVDLRAKVERLESLIFKLIDV